MHEAVVDREDPATDLVATDQQLTVTVTVVVVVVAAAFGTVCGTGTGVAVVAVELQLVLGNHQLHQLLAIGTAALTRQTVMQLVVFLNMAEIMKQIFTMSILNGSTHRSHIHIKHISIHKQQVRPMRSAFFG